MIADRNLDTPLGYVAAILVLAVAILFYPVIRLVDAWGRYTFAHRAYKRGQWANGRRVKV